jgi:uncharacterized membrane protein
MTEEDSDIYSAIILIFVGIILLLNNFGFLPWSYWSVLFQFWPLLIIDWGVALAFGRNSILHLVSFLLIVLAFIYSASVVSPKFNNWIESQVPSWKETRKRIPERKFQIEKRRVFRCDPITGECSVYYK